LHTSIIPENSNEEVNYNCKWVLRLFLASKLMTSLETVSQNDQNETSQTEEQLPDL
jgi:hypothetical protein